LQTDVLLQKVSEVKVDTAHGTFDRITFVSKYSHFTYHSFCLKGWSSEDVVPVRMHSANVVEDVFSFDKQNVLSRSLEIIRKRGFGALVYIVPSGPLEVSDPLDFGLGAQVLRELGIFRMQLITSAPLSRRKGLEGYGLEICSTVHPLDIS
jgi:3,4-dihydroxy 2-butanone 4-phosphate synthase/GTP cyclohydrolase II